MNKAVSTYERISALVGADDRKFLSKCARPFPLGWRGALAESYLVNLQDPAKTLFDANSRLREVSEQLLLKGTALKAGSSREAVDSFADLISKRLEREFFDVEASGTRQKAVLYVAKQVENAGLVFPVDLAKVPSFDVVHCDKGEPQSHITAWAQALQAPVIGALMRVFDPAWWSRKIRVIQARLLEKTARDLALVQRKKQVYCSDVTVSNRGEQHRRNRAMLEGFEVVSEEGQAVSLDACVDASTANPEIRRSELMVRMRGFEDLADQCGHVGAFFTLTAPSKYHAFHHYGAAVNNYNGATPRQVQEYLCAVWARVRSAWDRKGIKVYGFRVAEPHHDGTPHWHLLTFIESSQYGEAVAIFRRYAIEEDAAELRGVDKRGQKRERARFDVKKIDKSKGSATGYIAKYISKNINGYGVDLDHESGGSASEGARRVEAWAAVWGIRQFQQIGGAPVTVWRELRRISEEEALAWCDDKASELPETIKAARAAADASSWAAFVLLMGGAMVRRCDMPLQLWKQQAGENSYGELVQKIMGVFDKAAGLLNAVCTRLHVWTVRRVGSGEASEAAEVIRGAAPAWSSGNNCTGQDPGGDWADPGGDWADYQGVVYE